MRLNSFGKVITQTNSFYGALYFSVANDMETTFANVSAAMLDVVSILYITVKFRRTYRFHQLLDRFRYYIGKDEDGLA